MEKLEARLRRLERRDWWLWAASISVTLLLTGAVVSFTFPILLREYDLLYFVNLHQAVRALVGLVLLFNVYTIYQQVQIKRLRRELAAQIELVARVEMRATQFQKLAVHDPLTGLYNRRFAEERLEAEIARAYRHGLPLAAVVLDLDDFKQINDRYGHLAGDQVLKEFAEHLTKATRTSDLAVRMGGDEFLVLLPDCRPEQVEHLLGRLTHLEVDFHGHRIPISFSAGWADYRLGEKPEHLLDRADQALYAGKRTGKQRSLPTELPR